MRPILIGQNNPLSTRPGHELYPAPDGCTGHRLWRMLHARTGAFRQQYLDAFERRNLVRGMQFDRMRARASAYEFVCELSGSGRTIVLLGNAVREAFHWVLKDHGCLVQSGALDCDPHEIHGLPPVLIHPQQVAGCTWRQVPHPSGRNLWYNSEKNRHVVELLMEELYVEYVKTQQRESAT